jgi:predicted esterase
MKHKSAKIVLKPFVNLFLRLNRQHVETSGRIMEALYSDPFRKPTLLLGSERDEILPHSGFVEYRDLLVKKGIPVETRFWKGSGHVRLHKDYPEEYRDAVREFAKKNLLGNK